MRGYVNYNIHEDQEHYKVIIQPQGVLGNNITGSGKPSYTLDKREVKLHDPRNFNLGLLHCGLEFVNHSTSVARILDSYPVEKIKFDEDKDHPTQVIYEQELEKLLKDKNENIDYVAKFYHSFRSDGNPISLPVFHVHGDYTMVSGKERMSFVLKEKFQEWDEKCAHYGIVNTWRPIGDPVERSPLGLLDPATLSVEDWVRISYIYPEGGKQDEYQHKEHPALVYNKEHRWLGMDRMDQDMVWIFTQYDSHGLPTVPHSAVEVIGTSDDAKPRRSVETRMLVKYKE